LRTGSKPTVKHRTVSTYSVFAVSLQYYFKEDAHAVNNLSGASGDFGHIGAAGRRLHLTGKAFTFNYYLFIITFLVYCSHL